MAEKTPTLRGLLAGHWLWVAALVGVTILASCLSLLIPALFASAIDALGRRSFSGMPTVMSLVGLVIALVAANGAQIILQTYLSETIARDLRSHLVGKIVALAPPSVDARTPGALLTNITSDVDAAKSFVAHVIGNLSSSIFLVSAITPILLYLDWRLALAVLPIMAMIACTFHFLLGRVRVLFSQVFALIEKLNTVLYENIIGAALMRLVNSSDHEMRKFAGINSEIRLVNIAILRQFSLMIPLITFLGSAATFVLFGLGGTGVIHGGLTLGTFSAFNAYLAMMIYPLISIGLMSTTIANAQASLSRLSSLLTASSERQPGTQFAPLSGNIEVRDASLSFGDRRVLNHISFSVASRSKVAILGPTAAGKSQLIQLLAGVLPSDKKIFYDGIPIEMISPESVSKQVGVVFQTSSMFNSTLRENICLGRAIDGQELEKILHAAELKDFVSALPNGLDTLVSERGSTLSGGQKQRIMLARALVGKPNILFLDDFTARVDAATEKKILENLDEHYPELTLVIVSQKIRPIEHFDQIILLMEGDILATGRHETLLRTSAEYVQILQSQESIEADGWEESHISRRRDEVAAR